MQLRRPTWLAAVLAAGVLLVAGLYWWSERSEPSLRVAGWQQLHTGESDLDDGLGHPSSARLITVPTTPNVVYAASGVYGGADSTFKSTDGGATWRRIQPPEVLRFGLVAVDASRPGTLYGAGGDVFATKSLFKSSDGGASWVPANRGLGKASSAVVVDAKSPQTLYAGGGRGVFRSANGGESWSHVAGAPKYVQALALDPRRSSTLYVGTADGLFKSPDGGKSWRREQARWSFEMLEIDPRSPRTLYTWYREQNGLPDKSTNGGANWTELSRGLPDARFADSTRFTYPALAIDPSRRDTIYVAGFDLRANDTFVLKSTTGGDTWVIVARLQARTHDGAAIDFVSLAVDPTGRRVYAGTDFGGLFVCETCWKITSPARRQG